MHLQTGGRQGRFKLWQFSAGATKILDKKSDACQGLVEGETIPVDQITVAGHTLYADGYYWKTLPDETDVAITPTVKKCDYFVYGVGASPWTPQILLNTATTNANLDTDVPEVCVGQKVNFTLTGLPAISNMVGKWQLPGKFVNEAWQEKTVVGQNGSDPVYSYYGSINYRINNYLLQDTNSTSCWYINKPGGRVMVGMDLKMPNGQNVGIAAKGDFTVYRPYFSGFVALLNGVDYTVGYLKAYISWNLNLNSKYDGFYGFTQLLLGTGIIYGTGGSYYLDGNSEIYGEPDANGAKEYLVGNIATHRIRQEDQPEALTTPCVDMNIKFKDYLRFKPKGEDSIYATIATNNWLIDASACIGIGLTKSNCPPATTPLDSDELPTWEQVRPGGK
jgi:hypothetical protein